MQVNRYVLVIDDEPEILDVVCHELKRAGMTPVGASSATDARTRLGFHRFDLIVTDIMMPKENGIQFLVSLHNTISNGGKNTMPPVVIISAMELDAETRKRVSKLLRVELILPKPWDPAILRSFVETRILGKSRESTYDANILNIFLNATVRAIESVGREKPKAAKPFLKNEQLSLGEVTALIHFTGENLEGSMAISFKQECCAALAAEQLGETDDELSESILQDLTVEIASHVASEAQLSFLKSGVTFQVSTPSVISGIGHKVEHSIRAPCLVLPFRWREHEFFTEFVMNLNGGKKSDP